MILAYRELEGVLTLEEGRPYVLQVENPVLFRDMIQDLVAQTNGDDGKFVLSQDNKLLSISKHVALLTDLFAVEPNNRKVQQKLYAELEKLAVNEKLYTETQALKTYINKYVLSLVLESSYDLEHEYDFELKKLFGALDIHIRYAEEGFLGKLVTLLDAYHTFLNLDIIGFVNLSSMLTKAERKQLYKEAKQRNVNLLLLENANFAKIEDEKLIIVDDDLCVVYSDE